MYKVYCDNKLIYDRNVPDLKLFNAVLEIELNKTGSFNFTIGPSHPFYNSLKKLKSIIEIKRQNNTIFRGRILNENISFYNMKQVTCEGELAFLLDTIIRPYDFSEGNNRKTPAELLKWFIDRHNEQVGVEKQFKVDVNKVTVEDEDATNNDNKISRSNKEYSTTWNAITEKLTGSSLKGYFQVRHVVEEGKDVRYIDYLKDFDVLSNQAVTFGQNLLDINRAIKGEAIATAIIPLGKAQDGEDPIKLEFTDTPQYLGNGLYGVKDYIYNQKAVDEYGYIYTVVAWNDVEGLETLKKKAINHLTDISKILTTIEIKAVDLSAVNLNFNSFSLGTKVIVNSKYHFNEEELDKKYLVNKLSIDLLNPQNNTLTISSEYYTSSNTKSYTEQNHNSINEIHNDISKTASKQEGQLVEIDKIIQEVLEQTNSTISQTSTEIMSKVSNDYYLKDEANSLIESVNTKFTQTSESFNFKFNEFSQDINDVAAGADAKFQEINKYIKLVDGNIILGEDDNALVLKIQKDRISFLQNDIEVAYFSNNKLNVTDGEFINTLKLGKFAFTPRTNGNLSFKKVVE